MLLTQLLLGGVLGAVGQGIRVVIGLKKEYDDVQMTGLAFDKAFSRSELGVSLIIGFVAGVLAYISLVGLDTDLIDNNAVTALIGAGYAGTDFIEGFMKKYYVKKS